MSRTLAQLRASVRANINASPPEIGDVVLNEFINQAIDNAITDHLLVPLVDENLIWIESTYEYELENSPTPGNLDLLVYIYQIFEESETSGVFYSGPIPYSYWDVQSGSPPYLRFYTEGGLGISGRNLRIVGAGHQARVSADLDEIHLPPDYVIWKACSLAHGRLSGSTSPQRASWHGQQIQISEGRAENSRIQAHEWKLPNMYRYIWGRL